MVQVRRRSSTRGVSVQIYHREYQPHSLPWSRKIQRGSLWGSLWGLQCCWISWALNPGWNGAGPEREVVLRQLGDTNCTRLISHRAIEFGSQKMDPNWSSLESVESVSSISTASHGLMSVSHPFGLLWFIAWLEDVATSWNSSRHTSNSSLGASLGAKPKLKALIMWVRLFTKVLRKRRGEGRCVRMLDGINVLMHLVDVLAAIKSQRQLEVVPNMRTIL